jgi:2-iminobutanoate/2-iminopropanoate deaminase
VIKKAVCTDKAAQPKAPYSQGIVYGDLLFVSGAGPIDPSTQKFISGTIEAEAEATMKNIKGIVEAAGFSMEGLLKVTVFLADINDFDRFNVIYKKYVPEPRPARSAIEAVLAFGIKVEVEAVAGR